VVVSVGSGAKADKWSNNCHPTTLDGSVCSEGIRTPIPHYRTKEAHVELSDGFNPTPLEPAYLNKCMEIYNISISFVISDLAGKEHFIIRQ
jgi:hypothetical protein